MSKFGSEAVLEAIRGRLIVSCQAQPHEPLYGAAIMARMARAAAEGGAAAIRANTPADIAAIRAEVDLPIIGLFKVDLEGWDVFITPRVEDALAVAAAGADVVAMDATRRPHPEGPAADIVARMRRETALPVMADISTFDEAVAARAAGADLISTTLSGYTPYSPHIEGPDIDLVRRLALHFGPGYPLIAEGRIASPEQLRAAFAAGAFAVVVGGAITRPQQIAARFAGATPR